MSTALARRRRSLRLVTAASGGFGALTAAVLALVLVSLTGGGVIVGAVIVAFALAAGSAGGWLFGNLASRLLGDDGQ